MVNTIKKYFYGNFKANNFGNLLYPFLRIFKLLGFAPVKLHRGEVLKIKNKQFEWDFYGWIWSINLVIAYIGN